jgi:3-oxoacid CoA-transferase subunit A
MQIVDKVYSDAHAALTGLIHDDQLLAVGGFGLCGIPEALIEGLLESGCRGLTIISNNAGVDGFGLGKLLATRQIVKLISSYVGENREFEGQFLSGELDVEFTPQGTLAERLRAGGSGIPAFFTKTGVGTVVAQDKVTQRFDGDTFLLERALCPEVSLVKAYVADRSGNLRFRGSARNFNPVVAMAGATTVVEVERIVENGELDPDDVHLPGIYVHRVIENPNPEKRIEKRTTSALSES